MGLIKLNQLQRAYIVNLAYFDQASDGWKSRQDILKTNDEFKNKPANQVWPILTSRTNLTDCLKGLEDMDLVEASWQQYQDSRKRPHVRRIYRLRKTKKTFLAVLLYGSQDPFKTPFYASLSKATKKAIEEDKDRVAAQYAEEVEQMRDQYMQMAQQSEIALRALKKPRTEEVKK